MTQARQLRRNDKNFFMKKLFCLFILLVLTGAGCSLGQQKNVKNNDGGILKTANTGKQWMFSSAVPTAKGIGTLTTSNILNLEMDPQDNSVLYAGTREDGFLYSDDSGESWHQPRLKDLSTGTINAIKVNPKNVCTLYVAKGSRLYKTTDCMRTWQSDTYVESRADIEVVKIAVDWFNPENVWIGLSNGDVQKSKDSGKTWSNVFKADESISDILINGTDSRIVLVGTDRNGMSKTIDSGLTWININTVLQTMDGAKIVNDLTATKSGSVVVAATQYGLIQSKDFGSTWEPIKLVTSPGQVVIRAVAMEATDANQLYYATTSTFYKSTDGGVTWQTGKLPSTRMPYTLIIDPILKSVLYVGVASEQK